MYQDREVYQVYDAKRVMVQPGHYRALELYSCVNKKGVFAVILFSPLKGSFISCGNLECSSLPVTSAVVRNFAYLHNCNLDAAGLERRELCQIWELLSVTGRSCAHIGHFLDGHASIHWTIHTVGKEKSRLGVRNDRRSNYINQKMRANVFPSASSAPHLLGAAKKLRNVMPTFEPSNTKA